MILWQIKLQETGSFNAGDYRKYCGFISGYIFIFRSYIVFMVKPHFQHVWKHNSI